MAFISFIPGTIVCFINRSKRYPDLKNLIDRYSTLHSDDPVYLGFSQIYSVYFLQYDYIVSRSSTSSLIIGILQSIWMILLIQRLINYQI